MAVLQPPVRQNPGQKLQEYALTYAVAHRNLRTKEHPSRFAVDYGVARNVELRNSSHATPEPGLA
jgi:hypothetical protein